jgi:hypothetical protein
LTAALAPEEFIDLAWLDEFGVLADELWAAGIDVLQDLFGRYRTVGTALAPRATLAAIVSDAIEQARGAYLDLVKALTDKHAFSLGRAPLIMGEINQGGVVQYGDVRGLLVQLGGGSTDPSISLVGGITTGVTMRDYLADSGIETDEKIWLYGWEEQPRRTFNGHLQMDGLVFSEWDDNGLIIAPQDRWLRRNYYAPGDHYGCACVVAPYFPNFGDPFEI